MLLTSGSLYRDGVYQTRTPRASFSQNGRTWTRLVRFLAEDHWLWRVTWHGDVGYGVSKLGDGRDPRRGFLYRTVNGLDWEWITELRLPDGAWTVSETTVQIIDDDEMIALIRPNRIGSSRPPYIDWRFTTIDHSLGGPNFIRLPDGSLWASSRGRTDDGQSATMLATMTHNSYQPVLALPSGGDNSYPGMVWHDQMIWVSYYSSHEGKASIYLAKIAFDG